ncbi:MAG: alpha-amylase family glycosyl hydrolase [Bacilli bacterium]|nr:alpha-amylase family glycosyl hydrolase [Bacilli bacterium]
MKKKRLLIGGFAFAAMTLAGCGSVSGLASSGAVSGGGASSNAGSSSSFSSSSGASSPVSDSVKAYMDSLRKTSQGNHFYFHYYREGNLASDYDDWDMWIWGYRPKETEGAKFDWHGRTTSHDLLSATGEALPDDFGGAYVDVDLAKSYDGGWDAESKSMGGTEVSYLDGSGNIETKLGIQVVKTTTRSSSSSFWINDGQCYVKLEDFALRNDDGSVSYHVFGDEYHITAREVSAIPSDRGASSDPFAGDDGTNVTYGDDRYANASMVDKPIQPTSPAFLKGSDGGAQDTSLKRGAGVGYQIMVASFADSDGDGFGDIQGIVDKLDYLESLHVNALWLTPIQMSDSYHGYDVSDYTQVDPKFGSSVSKAAEANGGEVTPATAMEDYKLLLGEAHKRGMAVVMDLVINHTSSTNKWFTSSALLDPTYRGYYQWGNHETFSSKIKEANHWYPYGSTPYSYYAKFGSSMPELNYMYQSTRDAVAEITKDWASLGVDGFRMDAVKHIFMKDEIDASKVSMGHDTIIEDNASGVDYSSDLTKNLNFWRELAYDVKSVYPNVFFLGENFDGHAFHVAPYYEAFDSMFDFYGYFNLTSAANTAMGGGYGAVDFPAISGENATSGGLFAASGDTSATNPLTSIAHGGYWNLRSVLDTDNEYRTGETKAVGKEGYAAIGGMFTSNHDIARTVNRIHASAGSSTGVTEQGEVTGSDYASFDKEATLVQIAELMLPGCTWIYYGDELGMTGNLEGKKSTDGYADLAYRQPMKWKQGGRPGDGSGTCGYSITGSGTSVAWDKVNASPIVGSAEEQSASKASHLAGISSFAKFKSATPALIRGEYLPCGWSDSTSHYMNFQRILGEESYHVVINFDPSVTMTAGIAYSEVLATFGAVNSNGQKITSIGPQSAVLIKE